MSSQDILHFVLILGIFIITSCVVFITYFLVQTLKSITQLADNLEETTQSLKDKVKLKALAAVPALIVALASKVFKKRG